MPDEECALEDHSREDENNNNNKRSSKDKIKLCPSVAAMRGSERELLSG